MVFDGAMKVLRSIWGSPKYEVILVFDITSFVGGYRDPSR